jgi:hypothetical protein
MSNLQSEELKSRGRVTLTGLARRVKALERTVNLSHGPRIDNIENALNTIQDFGETLGKIKKALKFYGPVVIGAAVSAGLIDGRVGAFLRALFVGS